MTSRTSATTQARVECALALLAVALKQRHQLEALASQAELTPPQARVLVSLTGPMRMQDVAVANACEPSHVTGVAEQLEVAGLVRREQDPTDRRARRLSLTPAGEEVRARLIAGLIEGGTLIGDLDDAQVAMLMTLIGP